MPPDVRFPPVLKPAAGGILQIRLSQPPPGLSAGQTVEVRVLERIHDGRFVIDAGGNRLTAETEQPLRPGQAMAMRVESLHPRVVLSVLPPPVACVAAEHLRAFRASPDALAQSIAELAGLFGGSRPGGAAPLAGPDRLETLLAALRSVLTDLGRAGEGLSVRDFARALGLLTEHDLKKALERPGEKPLPLPASLKSCLTGILRETAPGGGGMIREWAPALEKALRAVENIQVLNVHLQENEGGLFLQVPLLFEGFTGKADILIRREGKGHGTDSRDGVFRALFALDMDALGDVMAQARFSGNAVACRIDCASGAAASFVAGLLPDLERRLAAAGYRVEDLEVRADSRVRERMQERIREELHGDGQALSVFA